MNSRLFTGSRESRELRLRGISNDETDFRGTGKGRTIPTLSMFPSSNCLAAVERGIELIFILSFPQNFVVIVSVAIVEPLPGEKFAARPIS